LEARIMEGARIFVLLLGIGLCLGTEDQQAPRSTRTIARFFGLESNPQPQQQQVVQQPHVASQVRKPVPLIYSVKYYDRTGEGEKVEVVPEHTVQDRVQGVPTRVFLNLYTGQQTPVYYDNKGQLLVPCPVYDHLYVAGVDPNLVRKPSPPKVVQTPVPVSPQVPVPQVQVPVPEIVYYATPSFVGHNPVQKQAGGGVGLTVVGVPYDFPYYPGIYPYGNGHGAFNPYGNGGYNPYVYIKPSPTGHHHGAPSQAGQTQQVVAQVAEKKEAEKTD